MENFLGPLAVGGHNTALLIAGGLMALLAWMARYRRPECSECGHCRERRNREGREAEARQHDYQHKGGGYRPGDPDRYPCDDPSCRRNPKR